MKYNRLIGYAIKKVGCSARENMALDAKMSWISDGLLYEKAKSFVNTVVAISGAMIASLVALFISPSVANRAAEIKPHISSAIFCLGATIVAAATWLLFHYIIGRSRHIHHNLIRDFVKAIMYIKKRNIILGYEFWRYQFSAIFIAVDSLILIVICAFMASSVYYVGCVVNVL